MLIQFSRHLYRASPAVHRQRLTLFGEPSLDINRRTEIQHQAIIDRCGRYPIAITYVDDDHAPRKLFF